MAESFALWPSIFKIISSQLVRSDRKNMIFLISLSTSGGLILAYIVAACIPKEAWRYNFAVSAISLIISAIVLDIFCRGLDPILKKDKEVTVSIKSKDTEHSETVSTGRLFLMSGFYAVLVAVLMRFMVESGMKNLCSAMLMQSYENVSPSMGNWLSIFIVVGGLAGILLAKFVLFPRIIKNEITGCLIMTALSLPLTFVLTLIGKASIWSIVLSLTVINLLLSTTHLLIQYYQFDYYYQDVFYDKFFYYYLFNFHIFFRNN